VGRATEGVRTGADVTGPSYRPDRPASAVIDDLRRDRLEPEPDTIGLLDRI
jgi:hypothetical protein